MTKRGLELHIVEMRMDSGDRWLVYWYELGPDKQPKNLEFDKFEDLVEFMKKYSGDPAEYEVVEDG